MEVAKHQRLEPDLTPRPNTRSFQDFKPKEIKDSGLFLVAAIERAGAELKWWEEELERLRRTKAAYYAQSVEAGEIPEVDQEASTHGGSSNVYWYIGWSGVLCCLVWPVRYMPNPCPMERSVICYGMGFSKPSNLSAPGIPTQGKLF
jgi:hypothetical protein